MIGRPFARVKDVKDEKQSCEVEKETSGSGSESFSNNLYYQTPRLNATGQSNFG